MEYTPTFKELLDVINSASESNKANCTIGLFANEYMDAPEGENGGIREIDSLIFKKPVVAITSALEDNEIYYTVQFSFCSCNDSDYKQMWKFLCRHAERAKREADLLAADKKLDKVIALTLSILPDEYRGKYFVYVNMPFWEGISCTESAFDKSAVISLICNDESLMAMESDDDMVDQRSIEREVEQDLLAELETTNPV